MISGRIRVRPFVVIMALGAVVMVGATYLVPLLTGTTAPMEHPRYTEGDTLYKWYDDDGQIQLTEEPPPDHVESQRLRYRPGDGQEDYEPVITPGEDPLR